MLGLAGVEISSKELALAGVKPPQLPILRSPSLVPPEVLFLKAGFWAVDVRMLN